MRIDRLIACFALLAVITVSPASAQQKPARPATAAPGSAAVPESRIALIYSEAFQDPKTGLVKFGNLMGTLNGEFQQRQNELNQLQQRITQLTKEIMAARDAADQKTIQQKSDQLEQSKREYQRRGEDVETAFNKRRQEILAPLQESIANALEIFAKAHGITVIIDASQVPLVYAADSIDVTRAFISDFNSKNPVTASVAPPR